jgi:hypothetical protein
VKLGAANAVQSAGQRGSIRSWGHPFKVAGCLSPELLRSSTAARRRPARRRSVNLNNFDPRLQVTVQVRHFDGADTWKFID